MVHAMKHGNHARAIEIGTQIRKQLLRLNDTVSAIRDLRNGYPNKILRQLEETELSLSSLVDRSTAQFGIHDAQPLSISTSIKERKKREQTQQALNEMNDSGDSDHESQEGATYVDVDPLICDDDISLNGELTNADFRPDQANSTRVANASSVVQTQLRRPSTMIQIDAT